MEFLRQVQTVEERRSRVKMDADMWNVALFNLCEAHGDARELCAAAAYLSEGKAPAGWEERLEWRKGKRGFGPGWFEVTMEHVYHHVNYAWNCRHAGAERAIKCSMRDFNRWEKFPTDWPELWPPPERWEGKWPKGRWAEHSWRTVRAAAMRPEFEAAEDALGLLVDGVFLRLGDGLDPARRRPERLRADAWAVSEEDFGALVRRFYCHFNAAWNARRCRKAGGGGRDRWLFPREMVRFWPESGRLPKFGEKGSHCISAGELGKCISEVRNGRGGAGGLQGGCGGTARGGGGVSAPCPAAESSLGTIKNRPARVERTGRGEGRNGGPGGLTTAPRDPQSLLLSDYLFGASFAAGC